MQNLEHEQDMGKGDYLFIDVINVKWGCACMFQELPYEPQLLIQLLPLPTHNLFMLWGIHINPSFLRISVKISLYLILFKSYGKYVILKQELNGHSGNVTEGLSWLWYLNAHTEGLNLKELAQPHLTHNSILSSPVTVFLGVCI
jgi:hypothetical protein